MLRNGATPIPPARKTAGFEVLRCKPKDPIGPLRFTWVPNGRIESARLNAESRMRVAINISSIKGELAIENVCVRQSEPSGLTPKRVRSIDWPARNKKSFGLSNRNATVSCATPVRLSSLLAQPSRDEPSCCDNSTREDTFHLNSYIARTPRQVPWQLDFETAGAGPSSNLRGMTCAGPTRRVVLLTCL